MARLQVVLITGLSGSGKSTALNTLEDLGYFCIDNLPTSLVPLLSERRELQDLKKIAISMDTRDPTFLSRYPEVIRGLEKLAAHLEVIFLEAEPRILQRRFSVTRRRHPLAREGSVTRAIRKEISSLRDLRRLAHRRIDTSRLVPRALNQTLMDHVSRLTETPSMEISIISFGFHFGRPEEADLQFDVRFLRNPFNVPTLKRFHGKNRSVKNYVLAARDSKTFLTHLFSLLRFLIPRFKAEGKSYLTIAIGCTGGQHRSVVIAEEVFRRLRVQKHRCHILHRDLGVEG